MNDKYYAVGIPSNGSLYLFNLHTIGMRIVLIPYTYRGVVCSYATRHVYGLDKIIKHRHYQGWIKQLLS